MKLINKAAIILTVIFASSVFIFAAKNPTEEKEVAKEIAGDFPVKLDFAGEETPLKISDVKERLDRELLVNVNLHASTILAIKRANRAFPVIEPILKKNGIPDDFKYLAVIESGLVNVVSPAGARGIWQFMPDTAKERGMEVNENVDQRYDLEKSTQAACSYFLSAKGKFGSWTLAAASYNGGMTGVNKQIDIQKVTNYYDLLLTEETSRYVFRILALKEIMENPVKYGFTIASEDLYATLPTKKIEIDSTITDLADFAKGQGINYKILKIHNPWLRETKLINDTGKKYQIEIPLKGY
ncbi:MULTISPECIES: lytic transglycosylase domain-containing protein [unclassified Flavobacterium]|uniref:lytic transglycosylase domain-containing protein n=1 Tax=unclassified Flavobacterium TaxID=196869 RepID=UPI000C18FDC2|nr:MULTISPECIES: lytic transglycosylase domain-containing protein [unclassified Flavobacterium]PIF63619.1 soluble lytic murein transglycosylase-like protein [Flavobacterium sp. 11]WKL44843.1 lytic transglycosylase domain-containing protein [Flavobacterium sp. ZE23DGlu08]